jgi:flavin reductase (DIM6/NTAB) family NADH-FMN oxidoreductase RutF/ADP-ribose pyrophosphatase YjhB (NUDIX family)
MTVKSSLDRQLLRNCYGSFPVGVTVVTTRDADGVLWGMTASSFNSISMDPPLVSISIIEQTPSHHAFTHSREFGISILGVEQADLARKFATPADDKFSGVGFENTGYGAPILANASAWLVCNPVQRLAVGDHTLLIGEVVACKANDVPALAYHRGGFFSLAEKSEAAKLPRRSHGAVGFIVEYDSKIALVRDNRTGRWSLPAGPPQAAPTIDESLRRTAKQLIGTEVEPDFLYSIADLHEHLACNIYRGRLLQAPTDTDRVRWFTEQEIPWSDLGSTVMTNVIRRYLEERVADQFGVFVSVGHGRIATIRSESDWPAHGQPT